MFLHNNNNLTSDKYNHTTTVKKNYWDIIIPKMIACEQDDDIFTVGRWLINNENTIVNDVLMGFVKCNPELAMLDIGRVIVQREHKQMDKVKILGGGCSGHEPAFAGFVGQGFLTAAIQGNNKNHLM